MRQLECRPIPSRPGMFAFSDGTVKLPEIPYYGYNGGLITRKTIRTLGVKTRASKASKHWYYGLYNRRLGNMKVHRLVCEAFHGPAPSPRHVVIHIDENGLNNRPENLMWGTQKQNLNMPKFIEYCRSRVGENNPNIKGMRKRAVA